MSFYIFFYFFKKLKYHNIFFFALFSKLKKQKIMKFRVLILFAILTNTLFAQKITLSGYVTDSTNGEPLIGATVFEANNRKNGTVTNSYGFFSLTLNASKSKINFYYIGFDPLELDLNLTKDTLIKVELVPNNQIGEVVVHGKGNKVESSQMSQIDVPVKAIRTMPVLFGEVDVLKTVQLLPGVQSGTEGTSGIYVRGGGPDQNLILLDGVPVYNVNHLFGFFSVFNGYAINDISLIKGGFPARYGGRLSSVLDIRMKEGNMKKFSGEVSIGVIASKFTFEGPIKKDKTSFIISGRRTYLDILTKPIMSIASAASSVSGTSFNGGYFFYDLNAKINHKFSDKDRIYLSAYLGKDKAYTNVTSLWDGDYSKSKFDLHWGNITTAFRWNHVINMKLFMNTTLTYSNYLFSTEAQEEYRYTWMGNATKEFWKIGYYSGIEDYAAKMDFDYVPNSSHKIKFGATGIFHIFKPGISIMNYTSVEEGIKIDTSFGNQNIYGREFGLYAEDDFRIGNRLKINAGVRATSFSVEDTIFYSIEPRLSARFLVNDNFSVKASYAKMSQYLHFLTNSTIGLPTDLWLPATKLVPPEHSWQTAVGTEFNLGQNYSLSLEGFYKEMQGIIEYKEGESFFSSMETEGGNSWEYKIERGKGWAYGGELFLRKKTGKFTGWLGYTLSWSNRQFPTISFGKVFPYRYDRRHDIGILLNYKLSDKVDIGATWVYGTGIAVTLARQRYLPVDQIQNRIDLNNQDNNNYYYYGEVSVEYYGSRNNFRLPAYHRLDIGINFHKQTKLGLRTWSFSIYNVYNRKNPFYVDFNGGLFGYDTDSKYGRQLFKYSLFPIIPSITYSLKFK